MESSGCPSVCPYLLTYSKYFTGWSCVWNFFVRMDKVTVICKLCRLPQKWNNTSNLGRHLALKHTEAYRQLQEQKQIRRAQNTLLSDFC